MRAAHVILALALAAAAACGDNIDPGPGDISGPGLIPCDSSADCAHPTPTCDPQSKVCVGCIASQQTCGAGLMCDEESRLCVPADPDARCRFDADCPRPGFDDIEAIFCDLESGRCVGCLTDIDCVEPRVCQPDTRLCREPTPDAGPEDAGTADAGADASL